MTVTVPVKLNDGQTVASPFQGAAHEMSAANAVSGQPYDEKTLTKQEQHNQEPVLV